MDAVEVKANAKAHARLLDNRVERPNRLGCQINASNPSIGFRVRNASSCTRPVPRVGFAARISFGFGLVTMDNLDVLVRVGHQVLQTFHKRWGQPHHPVPHSVLAVDHDRQLDRCLCADFQSRIYVFRDIPFLHRSLHMLCFLCFCFVLLLVLNSYTNTHKQQETKRSLPAIDLQYLDRHICGGCIEERSAEQKSGNIGGASAHPWDRRGFQRVHV